ncbi:MAG: deoxyribodipyrimidine photo-lyase [Candidatus Promineifilaceae bacterium]|nr:deoxyribodipyrimidine photo-lyase [Candidatus Promineifilaceae bacterium]
MTTVLWWIRRDLRLEDNRALAVAARSAEHVVPVWIFDPRLLNAPTTGQRRVAFVQEGLRRLDAALRQRGSRLVVRRGRPLAELKKLMAETGAGAIFAEGDHTPFARRRDRDVEKALPLRLLGGATIHPPGSVRKADGDPYVVYTPFRRSWEALPPPARDELMPAPETLPLPELSEELDSEPIPEEPALPDGVPFEPGEAAAGQRLQTFLENDIYNYAQRRDRLDLAGTSRLSPYLRFGMLSPRRAAVAAFEAIADAPAEASRDSARAWLGELIWRDFYAHVLYHFPHASRRAFREKYRAMAWNDDEAAYDAWRRGQTGYPVVDAAMRQLAESGWMHNRGRMIVASFLTKHLLLDWRKGEAWFMQQLVDGDPAANNGGWQWAAGTGTDAAPYFRIFNPTSQGEKHDPDGAYVRHWVPELAGVPDEYVHAPWEMPETVQEEAGCIVGEDYPAPIVDHQAARKRALDAYKSVQESDS